MKVEKTTLPLTKTLPIALAFFIGDKFILSGVGVATALPSSGQGTSLNSSLSPQIGIPYECRVLSNAVNTTYLWTPVVLINSPYGGSASGYSTTEVYSRYSFSYGPGPYTTQTSEEATYWVSATDGNSSGIFLPYKWVSYPTKTYAVIGNGVNQYCAQPYVSEISGNPLNVAYLGYYTGSPPSDAGEPTNLPAYEGYNFVAFHNGYTSDNSGYSACDAPGAQYSVSDSTIETISVSGGYDTVSGDMSIILGTGASTSFTYIFPAYGVWDVTFLGNGYPSALAFDYVSSNSGCTP
ncbi:MAG: hypothetical protein M1464_05945 [Candidatus Thermoplasmatota archaeon]|nr:hypothetical protein [Candidatus Thermoplasmatota archaeon]